MRLALGSKPPIQEITTHTKTSEGKQFGVQQKLNNMVFARCSNCTKMYHFWIMGKGEDRRKLICTLRAIAYNNVAYSYEHHLKTVFVCT